MKMSKRMICLSYDIVKGVANNKTHQAVQSRGWMLQTYQKLRPGIVVRAHLPLPWTRRPPLIRS